MRTLALLDESREEYERRRVLIAQRVAEGSQLQQQVEESRKRVAAAREETAAIRAKAVQTAGSVRALAEAGAGVAREHAALDAELLRLERALSEGVAALDAQQQASHEEELALAARLPTERAACADGLRDARAAEGRGRVALALLEAEAAAEAAEAVKGAAAASG